MRKNKNDKKVKETGTNETHLGRKRINNEEVIAEPKSIRVFQKIAIYKINYKAV
jgi:hypothetical protein